MIFHLNVHTGHDTVDHYDHDHLEVDLDVPMASDEPSGFSAALWNAVKTYHLLTVAFVFMVMVAYVRLQRRRRRTQIPVTDYGGLPDLEPTRGNDMLRDKHARYTIARCVFVRDRHYLVAPHPAGLCGINGIRG